jgi:hypothetical protein
MKQKMVDKIALLGLLLPLLGSCINTDKQSVEKDHWRFVSIPDFLNVDTDFPQDGWEESLSFVLEEVQNENPDFLTVAGDLVMGRWHGEPKKPGLEGIKHFAAHYYPAWIARMDSHGMKYYTGIGDHEVGDDPWRYEEALEYVAAYKKEFREHMGMPLNGPEHMKGTAFYWKHKNTLFVSVDVFEEGESHKGKIRTRVTGKQLEWFESVLNENRDVDHIIVMGHTPVLGPVRLWSTSAIMLEEGRESQFWQTMAKHNVALYLCGEVHAITCTERDGVQQIAHGGLFGYNPRVNYLVVDVYPAKLELTLKELDVTPKGDDYLWQPGRNRPLERISIHPDVQKEGFITVGTLTIDTSVYPYKYENAKGYFLKKYETSSEVGKPVFKVRSNPPEASDIPPLKRITIEDY